jgi:putative transposase
MSVRPVCYKRHRFPPEIISHAVWLYFRFPLSLRLVEEMLLERGILVSYETIRRWALKFGADYSRRLKRKGALAPRRLASRRGRHLHQWREALSLARRRSRRLCPRRNCANPPEHKGGATFADKAFTQARLSAEADHNRQTRLLRLRQAKDHAESRASPAQGAKQSGGEFPRSRAKTGADDAGLSIMVGIVAVGLKILRCPKSFRPTFSQRSAISTHLHRPAAQRRAGRRYRDRKDPSGHRHREKLHPRRRPGTIL